MTKYKQGNNTPYGSGVPLGLDDEDAKGIAILVGAFALVVGSLWVFNPPKLNKIEYFGNKVLIDSIYNAKRDSIKKEYRLQLEFLKNQRENALERELTKSIDIYNKQNAKENKEQ